MNEKIKALVITSLSQCDAAKMTPLSSSVDNGDGVDIPLEFAEKFAELIVKECISAVRENYVDRGTTEAVLSIEKHFGVTE